MYQSRIRNSKQRAKQSRNRTILEPDEDQEYGIVQDMLGNGRLRALCSDAVVRVGRIRGSMRKYAGKVIIERGDLVILAKRDFEDDKVDVVHKFTHEETSKLMRNGMLPTALVKEMNKSAYGESSNAGNEFIVFMDDDEAPPADDDLDISRI